MVKQAYLAELNKYLHQDEERPATRNHVDYLQVNTNTPVDVVLSAYLASRERVIARGPRRARRSGR